MGKVLPFVVKTTGHDNPEPNTFQASTPQKGLLVTLKLSRSTTLEVDALCQGICTALLSWICGGILDIGHCHVATALSIASVTIFMSRVYVNLKKQLTIYWARFTKINP
jgi:hypothetical protein